MRDEETNANTSYVSIVFEEHSEDKTRWRNRDKLTVLGILMTKSTMRRRRQNIIEINVTRKTKLFVIYMKPSKILQQKLERKVKSEYTNGNNRKSGRIHKDVNSKKLNAK